MSLTLKPYRNYRPIYVIARSYCEKSIYQREEEGQKPRLVHGHVYTDWRKPWIQRDGEWRSKLSVFVEKNPNPNVLSALSKIPSLNIQMIKDWWAEMKELQDIENQRFMKERVAALGSNLAAVHFFTFRRAAVRCLTFTFLCISYYSFRQLNLLTVTLMYIIINVYMTKNNVTSVPTS